MLEPHYPLSRREKGQDDLLSRAAVPVLYYLLKRSEERKASAETKPTPSPDPERSLA